MKEIWRNGDDSPLIVASSSRLNFGVVCYAKVDPVFANGSGVNAKRVSYTPPTHPNEIRRLHSEKELADCDTIALSIYDFADRFGGEVKTTRAR